VGVFKQTTSSLRLLSCSAANHEVQTMETERMRYPSAGLQKRYALYKNYIGGPSCQGFVTCPAGAKFSGKREVDPKGWSTVLVTALGSILGKPVPAAGPPRQENIGEDARGPHVGRVKARQLPRRSSRSSR
jgi:hypothetical protein